MQNKIIGFIGGGNMAASMIGGLVATGHDPERILVTAATEQTRDRLTSEHGVIALADNAVVAAQAHILVLAVKPRVMPEVLRQLASPIRVRKPLVISVAAGLPLRLYRDALGPEIPLVRAMPNTPSLVRADITGAIIDASDEKEARRLTTAILGAIGEVRWLSTDAELDALSTVSGSGPAYFFYLMECLQAAGEKLGMTPELARDLVLHTAFGAAKLALRDGAAPAELRARVTSPGGTTEQALKVMRAAKLEEVMDNALQAALQRAQDLSREA